MTQPQELPKKDLVKRSVLGTVAVIGFLAIAVIAGRKPAITLDKSGPDAAPSRYEGAPAKPFASDTTRNPFTPESYGTNGSSHQPLSADALLAELARRNGQSGALESDLLPPVQYTNNDRDAPPPPTAAVATNSIGTIDMRAPVDNQPTGTVTVSENALRPGDIVRLQMSGSVSSDFPGAPWVAIVTQDVPLGNGRVAIPAGSRVIGSVKLFNGPNAPIQSRIMLQSSTIVLPDGRLLAPEAYITDADGTGAVAGKTKRHLVAQVGGVLGAAVLGAGAAASTGNAPTSTQSALEADAAAGAAQQATPFATKYLSVQPTITLSAGQSVSLVLTAPLEIPPNAS